MKRSFVFFLLCAVQLPVMAQLQPVYTFQKDDTVLKRRYYEESLQKKKILVNSLGKDNTGEYKKIYEERFKETGELLLSSRTVTDPVAQRYLQAVVNKIIEANEVLKGTDVRVVFTRDWWPNAYSMGDGNIAVNAGLMIYLNNEAELVFVLCHELAHYYLDHSGTAIKKYVETVNSDAFQKELKRLSKEQFRVNEQAEKLEKSLVFDSRRHSRSNEAEADRQAFSFMKRTAYDCNGMKTGLELLDKIDDSLLYQPLKMEEVFNFTGYPFKKKWIQPESSIFSQVNEDDSPLSKKEMDSLKTHPDCIHRISLLMDSLQSHTGGNKFIVDEKIFNQLKNDFFPEITEECYKEENLSRNLYYSLLLLQAEKNKPMAVYSVARCLNHIYESQRDHKLGLMLDKENKHYPKDYNMLLRIVSRLRLDEIAAINYYFCNQYKPLMKDYTGFEDEMNKAAKYKN